MARALQRPEEQGDNRTDEQTATTPDQSVVAANFWHSQTFEELARAQGVQSVEKLEDIMGGWPEDHLDDGFEDAIRVMRQEDLRREQRH